MTAGDAKFELEFEASMLGGFGLRLFADIPETDESSLTTDLLLSDEISDDEDDTVESDGGAGYLERLAGLTCSPLFKTGTTGAEAVL